MKERIEAYFKAGYPAVYIVSAEEQRVEDMVKSITQTVPVGKPVRNLVWSSVTGVIDLSGETPKFEDCRSPDEAVDLLIGLDEPAVLLLRDIHAYLGDDADPVLVRHFREALRTLKTDGTAAKMLLFCGPVLNLPPELEREMPVLDLPLPSKEELAGMVRTLCAHNNLPEPDADLMDRLVGAAGGLTSLEAENALAISVVQTGRPDPAVLAREKAQTLRKSGVLEIVDPGRSLDDVGGLDLLKGWIRKRRRAFGQAARDFGLPIPRGLLILGLPGCGKSMTARATASSLGVPLLRLDMGRIFGSLVGQSEQRIREAIQIAEAISPCCLWVDEIDKGVAGSQGGQTDGGTAARVLGTLLTWMQEKDSPVFVVATANNPWMLPAPLVRKGRFDELFYVDLPTADERREIWNIHLRRYAPKARLGEATVKVLADKSQGLTGSEIEACVTEALSTAFDEEADGLAYEHLQAALADCTPLSKTMAGELSKIREWVGGRARPASSAQPGGLPTGGRRVITTQQSLN